MDVQLKHIAFYRPYDTEYEWRMKNEENFPKGLQTR